MIALFVALVAAIPACANAQDASSLFAEDPRPAEINPEAEILPVGPHPCDGVDLSRSNDLVGDWLALSERDDGWLLERAEVGFLPNGAIWTSSPGARYVFRNVDALTVGTVEAATIRHGSDGQIITFGDRDWEFGPIGYLVAMKQGTQTWWFTPRSQEEIDAFQSDPMAEYSYGAQCLGSGGPACPAASESAQFFHIVWSGDLDRDSEPDFILSWSQVEVWGEILGLSGSAPPGAQLELSAIGWGTLVDYEYKCEESVPER